MADYSVTQTVPTVFLDKRGVAVNGWKVYFILTEFDEIHEVSVASLNPEVVKRAIEDVLANRKALASLGKTK